MGKTNYLDKKKAQTHHSQNWPCTATIHQWRSLRLWMRILLGNSYLLITSLSRCKFVLGSEHDMCLLRNTLQNYIKILIFYASNCENHIKCDYFVQIFRF